MNNPKICVITPTYNRPKLLKQAIDSFIVQRYDNKEMVVINDGGKPDPYEKLIYKYSDHPVLFLEDKTNNGCPSALNHGVLASESDLVCILADDDLLANRTSLSDRVKAFEDDPELEVVYTGAYDIDLSGKITNQHEVHAVDKNLIWQRDYINIQSMMWRRSIHEKIGYFSADLINNEDWEFKIKCLMECKVEPLTLYTVKSRYHGENKSIKDREMTNKCAEILMERMKLRYRKDE